MYLPISTTTTLAQLLGLHSCATMPSSYVSPGDINSGPHVVPYWLCHLLSPTSVPSAQTNPPKESRPVKEYLLAPSSACHFHSALCLRL